MGKGIPKPTGTELTILRILWDHGPCRVRDVARHLSDQRGEEVGYTTALKFLQIMFEKGLVLRDESERSHLYEARHLREDVQRNAVRDLADKIFGGAAGELALQALSSKKVSSDDLIKLRAMLDRLEINEKRGLKNE